MDAKHVSLPRATALSRRVLLRSGLGMGLTGALAGAMASGWRPGGGRTAHLAGAATPAAAGPDVDCSASPAASPAAGAPVASPVAAVEVRMTVQLRFEPPAVTIRTGETVTWINDSPLPHTATDDPEKNPVAEAFPEYALRPACAAPWDSGLLQPGQSFSHTFDVPGDYAYFCIPHVLSGMRGTIDVRD
jgi:plastocyanin